jgi:excisionase family DNA binding protein
MGEDEMLTVQEAAVEKDTHVKSVYRAIQEGRLKAERRGPRILLIRRGDLDAWEPSRRIREAAKKKSGAT